MNYEYFISRRIRSGKGSRFSTPIVRVSITGIALGLAVMLISVAILNGFQGQVRDKVAGFGGHIQVTGFDSNNSYETDPVALPEVHADKLRQIEGVTDVQPTCQKAGIISTDGQIEGIVFKGTGKNYNWEFLKSRLTNGRVPHNADTNAGNEVLISKKIANLLNLKTGDPLRMYFIIGNSTRGRKFSICGIYDTGLAEFDQTYVFGDMRHIQRLNGWSDSLVSNVEITITGFNKLDKIAEEVYLITGYKLNTVTVKQLYPQIFDWIEIQDLNVLIILILMALVSGITMISTLLILVLEHSHDVGMLKAIGATNRSIRKIFIYTSLNISFYGLLLGNIFALGLIILQSVYGFIPLPEDSYFVSTVPVQIGVGEVLIINLVTLMICTAMMLLPSLVIRYISPVKAIRFE